MSEPGRSPKVETQHAATPRTATRADPLDVIVVAPPDDEIAYLIRKLRRLRAQVRLVWPMQETMPAGADVIFCEYIRDLAQRLQRSAAS